MFAKSPAARGVLKRMFCEKVSNESDERVTSCADLKKKKILPQNEKNAFGVFERHTGSTVQSPEKIR